MSRSSLPSQKLIGMAMGIGVAGLLGWFAMRLARAQLQRRATPQAKTPAISLQSSAAVTEIDAATETREIIPSAVLTDEEPTVIEAAFRDAVINERDGVAASLVTATWIGNTRTFVFHRADSSFLPAEDHRQYFQSEAEAVAAGYRRAANE